MTAPGRVDWDAVRGMIGMQAFRQGYYAGVPVPVEGAPRLAIESRHPLRAMLESLGGATVEGEAPAAEERDDSGVVPISAFWVRRERRVVFTYREAGSARVRWCFEFPFEREEWHRFRMLFDTMVAGLAHPLPAEEAAMARLRTLVTEAQWAAYVTAGMFMEKSTRSQARYLFRRLRPTLVLLPGKGPDASFLATTALCMHPIGYYQRSFAGALVPTDDLIAHLLLMRADEHLFWRRCNQHPLWRIEAGL